MIEKKDQFETMTIVITFDILHNNYNTIIESIFENGNKFINEIFAIIQSKKAKFKSKRATKNISNVAMTIQSKNNNFSF